MAPQDATPAGTRRIAAAIKERRMSGRAVRLGTTKVYDTGPGHASGTDKKPAGKCRRVAMVDRFRVCFASEAHPEHALDKMHVALEVLRRDPMAVEIRGAKVDKRDRAPKQVSLTVRQKFVAAGLDQGLI